VKVRKVAEKAYQHRRGIAVTAAIGTVAAGVGTAFVASKLLHRVRPKRDLHGNVVFITGGSRGLGLAMAHEFARQGARIAICARGSRDLGVAREQLLRHGAQVLAVNCDVSSDEDVNRAIRETVAHYGGIDVLVNNAGIISVGPAEAQNLLDYQESMDVMFWGTVYSTKAVLPHMRARGSGHIVNITSIGGKISVPHLLPYNCAKFATVGFSQGLHAELAKDGIRVTTVVPGLMRTGSYVNAYFKGRAQAEKSWFSVASSLPLLAKDARQSARQIVNAVRAGKAELTITPQAKLLAIVNGVAPGITSELMGLANRLLPASGGADSERRLGKDVASIAAQSPLTYLGRKAGRELNQYSEESGGGTAALFGRPGTSATRPA
jgi:NAD(P)-dependent dehydrogenase (short-subunit alcohol dehydrogenase family)